MLEVQTFFLPSTHTRQLVLTNAVVTEVTVRSGKRLGRRNVVSTLCV